VTKHNHFSAERWYLLLVFIIMYVKVFGRLKARFSRQPSETTSTA